jgi:hypothetical protein
MYIRNNTLNFINDNGITIVDAQAGLTEHVEIMNNTILNPITSGIVFGADGEKNVDIPGMMVRDVTIAGNHITGFFAAGIEGRLPETAEEVRVLDNVIQAQRDTALGPGRFVHGIALRPGKAALNIATGLHVEGNTVAAFGNHAAFNTAGMLFEGPVQNLTVADNDVRCDGCLTIERGIWLSSGGFENVTLLHNTVDNAGQALRVGYGDDTKIRVRNATILANTFLNSTSSADGQISLIIHARSRIEARIANNVIHDGSGYGILCQGAGQFLLTDLLTNNFADNVKGDIFDCP